MDVKITININGKQEEITVYQAKKIYDELHIIFSSNPPTYSTSSGNYPWEPWVSTFGTDTYQGQDEYDIFTSEDVQSFIDWNDMEEGENLSGDLYDKWYAQE